MSTLPLSHPSLCTICTSCGSVRVTTQHIMTNDMPVLQNIAIEHHLRRPAEWRLPTDAMDNLSSALALASHNSIMPSPLAPVARNVGPCRDEAGPGRTCTSIISLTRADKTRCIYYRHASMAHSTVGIQVNVCSRHCALSFVVPGRISKLPCRPFQPFQPCLQQASCNKPCNPH